MPAILRVFPFLVFPICATAQTVDWAEVMREAEWDWRPGDLIFRNGLDDLDEMIRQAEGANWSSVGILRTASGDPRVVIVDRNEGVTERMLYEYIDGLAPDEYAVYRIDALDVNAPGKQMEMGPVASFALLSAYGAPFDERRTFGNAAYYNAELPFEAAKKFGVLLGQPVKLRDLGAANSALREKLLENWSDNRLCRHATSAEDCWNHMGAVAIITPGALIASGAMRQVWPE
ncbi:C40 family peptidase [Paracoccus xiamenensis]|uniref:peptidoglycan peptidase n=1 Tax=Paracoccus xiamenensis TaxID=2714901 RepID=UPI00140B788A|nr:peptidoglycan peptidase [Paracoccus xiamenensis]NHF73335.1 peptidoglycan peptidase [Paracoccus xiamenensis]